MPFSIIVITTVITVIDLQINELAFTQRLNFKQLKSYFYIYL